MFFKSVLPRKIDDLFAAFADLRSFYLFVYNMFMWVGYSYVFIAIFVRYFRDGEGMYSGMVHLSGIYTKMSIKSFNSKMKTPQR